MFILLTILIAFLLSPLLAGALLSVPGYRGSLRDHFDGKKFINPGGVKAKGFKDLIRWARNRKQGIWENHLPEESFSPPDTDIKDGQIRVTFINHSTFLIQINGLKILTDPIWSKRAGPFGLIGPKRIKPAGVPLDDLPEIDIILLSHNHYDHLDLPTLKRLKKRYDPFIITPLGVSGFLKQKGFKKVHELDWWEQYSLLNGAKLFCVPAQHFSGRGLFDRDTTLWCGYVLQDMPGTLYFAGDTGYGDFFKRIGEKFHPIKVSILPIGAYKPEWFMQPIHTSPEEAVQIHLDVKSSVSVASHYGTFPLADDGRLDPVDDLLKALQKHNISHHRFLALKQGESADF